MREDYMEESRAQASQGELMTDQPSAEPTISGEKAQKAKTIALVTYALYVLGFLTIVSPIVAVIVNYLQRAETKNSFLLSHHVWMIRTFWWSLVWSVLGVALAFFFIGYFVLAAVFVWYIYRIVRGVLGVLNEKPMYEYNV